MGLSVHTGWAVAVVVEGAVPAPSVLDRRRLIIADPSLRVDAYHAGQELPLAATEEIVTRVKDGASVAARREVGGLVEFASDAGVPIATVGLVGRPRTVPQDVVTIIRSHTMMHTAEGVLYQRALADACADHGLSVTYVPPKQMPAITGRALGLDEAACDALVRATGKELGPPWRVDHKMAFLAALVSAAN